MLRRRRLLGLAHGLALEESAAGLVGTEGTPAAGSAAGATGERESTFWRPSRQCIGLRVTDGEPDALQDASRRRWHSGRRRSDHTAPAPPPRAEALRREHLQRSGTSSETPQGRSRGDAGWPRGTARRLPRSSRLSRFAVLRFGYISRDDSP